MRIYPKHLCVLLATVIGDSQQYCVDMSTWTKREAFMFERCDWKLRLLVIAW